MPLSLIAALADNGCIGKDGQLPWHIPEDLKRFKELTLGKTVLMGRKTWESLPEKFRPLPGRTNVVITRQPDYAVPNGVFVYPSLEEALAAHTDEEIMVIGGAEIYRQTIDLADKLFLTRIHQNVDGDTFFPVIRSTEWIMTTREDRDGFSWIDYAKF